MNKQEQAFAKIKEKTLPDFSFLTRLFEPLSYAGAQYNHRAEKCSGNIPVLCKIRGNTLKVKFASQTSTEALPGPLWSCVA